MDDPDLSAEPKKPIWPSHAAWFRTQASRVPRRRIVRRRTPATCPRPHSSIVASSSGESRPRLRGGGQLDNVVRRRLDEVAQLRGPQLETFALLGGIAM